MALFSRRKHRIEIELHRARPDTRPSSSDQVRACAYPMRARPPAHSGGKEEKRAPRWHVFDSPPKEPRLLPASCLARQRFEEVLPAMKRSEREARRVVW